MRRTTACENSYLGERAIVVDGGLAGLSAARALADRFREVMIKSGIITKLLTPFRMRLKKVEAA